MDPKVNLKLKFFLPLSEFLPFFPSSKFLAKKLAFSLFDKGESGLRRSFNPSY